MLDTLLSIGMAISFILIIFIFYYFSKMDNCLKNSMFKLKITILFFCNLIFTIIILYFKEPMYFLYTSLLLFFLILYLSYITIINLLKTQEELYITIGEKTEELEQIVFIKEQEINNLEKKLQ